MPDRDWLVAGARALLVTILIFLGLQVSSGDKVVDMLVVWQAIDGAVI